MSVEGQFLEGPLCGVSDLISQLEPLLYVAVSMLCGVPCWGLSQI